jgi:alcohol dehydrogenase
MRAVTYQGPDHVLVEEVKDPELADPLGAVVRVAAAGICGSDLHIFHGHGFSEDRGYPLGHEAVGEVVEVGSQVRRFAVGDRVLVCASVGCVLCAACARPRHRLRASPRPVEAVLLRHESPIARQPGRVRGGPAR